MQSYNDLISAHLNRNKQNMIHHLEQPTMFLRDDNATLYGGKRTRQFVLPTPLAAQYPSSLAVGGNYQDTMGGGFWSDLGNSAKSVGQHLLPVATDIAKDVGKDALMSYMKGGAVQAYRNTAPFPPYQTDTEPYILREGAIGRGRGRPKKCGAGFWGDLGKGASAVGKHLLPVATDVAKEVGTDMLKSYMKGEGRRRGRPRKSDMQGAGFWDSMKSIGSAAAEGLAPIGKDLAKEALTSYMKGEGRKPRKGDMEGAGFWGDFGKGFTSVMKVAEPFIPLLMAAAGRSNGNPHHYLQHAAEAHQHMNGGGGMESFLKIAKSVAPFIPMLMKGMGRGEGRKTGGGWEDMIKKVGNSVGKPFEISGVNPFDFGYNLGHDTIAPELFKVLPPEKVHAFFGAKGRGGAMIAPSGDGTRLGGYPKAGGKRPASAKQLARGKLVSQLMKSHGFTLGQASKHIKEHQLL